MIIKMTGYSGYLGGKISNQLKAKGHKVEPIDRNYLYGSVEEMSRYIANTDVIINLAGAPILKRWTTKNKTEIYESRIVTTQNIVKAINLLPLEAQPKKFISGSAIGLYKTGVEHDETSTCFESGFLRKVALDWERASEDLPKNIVRIIFRISMVLGKDAAAVKLMKIPFKMGLGGKIGNGKQPFPFIHEEDLVKAFVNAVENFEESKTYNLVAPQNINNKDFTKSMGKILNRPTLIPVPKFALKVLYGKSAQLLIDAPQVIPRALLEDGFKFDYPTIDDALKEIFKQK